MVIYMSVYNTRRRNNSSHRSEAVFRDFNPRPRSSVQRVCGIKLYINIV